MSITRGNEGRVCGKVVSQTEKKQDSEAKASACSVSKRRTVFIDRVEELEHAFIGSVRTKLIQHRVNLGWACIQAERTRRELSKTTVQL